MWRAWRRMSRMWCASRRPPERPSWLTFVDRLGGLVAQAFRPRSRPWCRIVAKPSVRQEPFPSGLLFVRGCRVHLPSVWFTRCACPTGLVMFRFILLCLCLPVSRGRIGGTVVASPCQGTCHVACLPARRVVFRPPASRTFLLKGFVDSAGGKRMNNETFQKRRN